ncbi:MAG: hypothetical protein NVSMB14_01300 [Isosphaeraceae bacterium]
MDQPVSPTPGTQESDGNVVEAAIPTDPNDANNVTQNPDQGRIVIERPDGETYTTTPSVKALDKDGVTPITLITEQA